MAFNPLTFVKEAQTELARVIWPSRSQTLRMTIAVIVGSVIIGSYIAGLDAVFTKLTETFLR